jgi:uncharacterized protein YpiB (UPF0302 family)
MTQFIKFIDDARDQNKKILIFEDGSKFYDFCFKKDGDILLNPHKNGYSWNMLKEFEGNYDSFLNTIIRFVDVNDEKAKIYLSDILLNIEKMVTTQLAENFAYKIRGL